MNSDIEIDADTLDEANIKLAMYFVRQLQQRPILTIQNMVLDPLGQLMDIIPDIEISEDTGYIDVEYISGFNPPTMLQ